MCLSNSRWPRWMGWRGRGCVSVSDAADVPLTPYNSLQRATVGDAAVSSVEAHPFSSPEPVEAERLEAALRRLVQGHAALHWRLVRSAGGWEQRRLSWAEL